MSGRGGGAVPASVKGLASGFRQMRKPWAVLGSAAEPPPWGKLSQGPRKSPWTLRSSGDPVCHLPLATVTHEHKQWLQRTQTCYPPVLQARSPKSVSRGSKGDSLPLYFFLGGGEWMLFLRFSRGSVSHSLFLLCFHHHISSSRC